MTRSEAAANLLQYLKENENPGSVWAKSLDMAISALREQEERSKGCEYCREAENIYYHAGEVNALDELLYITGDDLVVDIGCRFYLAASIKFCPMCGRRLEET